MRSERPQGAVRPRVLVTGATGLIGPYLVEAASAYGAVTGLSRHSRPACDLTDAAAVRQAIGALAPDLVVHAAALTDVDACERAPAVADAVNHMATANVAAALPKGAGMILLSTDQVYPDRPGPHREDGAAPVNAYGRSKLAGEAAALADGALVLRTNGFGPSRTLGRQSISDFVILNLAAHRPIQLFRDISFSPLHFATLATLAVQLWRAGATGVVNLGCRDGTSKRDFAIAVAARFGLSTAMATDADGAILPGRAPRPRDMRMDTARAEALLGYPMPTLTEEIAKL